MLPFGLCSAPKLLTAVHVADGLAWALCCRGITSFLYYLDDFFCASSTLAACSKALEVAVTLYMCAKLGLPIIPVKLEGPSTVVTFLGIEIDSVAQELRLPQANWPAFRLPISTGRDAGPPPSVMYNHSLAFLTMPQPWSGLAVPSHGSLATP